MFINKWLLFFCIKGKGNKVITLHKDKEYNVRTKCLKSCLKISGDNNLIKFDSKAKVFFKGINLSIKGCNNIIYFKNYKQSSFKNLKISITGSNNYIEINGPIVFFNTEMELNNNDNVFIIQKTNKPVKKCYFCLSGLSEVNISSDCGLNMGLYAIINNNYKERHKLIIGKGVFIGKDVIIRTSDGHSLIDPETKLAINEPQDVIIGDNVWIGARSVILKGAKIPQGSVVGAQSLVNKKYDTSHILLAGIPAKIRREDVYWDIMDYNEYMRNYEH
jgi:acetyltransferase-like isoleucine patch superfamily enzyme